MFLETDPRFRRNTQVRFLRNADVSMAKLAARAAESTRGVVAWAVSPAAQKPEDLAAFITAMPHRREVTRRLLEFEVPASKDTGYVYIAHTAGLGKVTIGANGMDGGFVDVEPSVASVAPDGQRTTYTVLRTAYAVGGGQSSMRIHLRFFDLPE